MLDQETVSQQLKLLATYRQTLAHLVQQAAQYGGEPFALPQTANSLAEARIQIARIKKLLRENGVQVEDGPNDEEPTQPEQAQIRARYNALNTREVEKRLQLLRNVETSWVKGVLHDSLNSLSFIEMDMQTQPEAVEYPWEMLVYRPYQEARPLQSGTPISKVFEDMNSELLILGAPGAGKTTLLLALAEQLIAHARADETSLLPVVFQLSTWSGQAPSLAVWMVDELNTRYSVARSISERWIQEDVILPLLDGLDELREQDRAMCVTAINAFRREHSVPLAVCSRVEEYKTLTVRLQLHGAVLIQPLTPKRINDHLARQGEQLASLGDAVRHDNILSALATSPLLLNIMALTYRNTVPPQSADRETLRQQIWEDYVANRFNHPRACVSHNHTDHARLRNRLAWLACGMLAHDQQVFYIEYLQPTWLSNQAQCYAWHLINGLIVGLVAALACALIGGIIGGLSLGLIGGLIGGLGLGLGSALEVRVQIVEKLSWSWRGIGSHWRTNVLWGLIWGLVVGLIVGLVFGAIFGVVCGLSGGLIGGLVGALIDGLEGNEIEARFRPNQGIWQSARSALVGGLVSALLSALMWGLIGGLVGELLLDLDGALTWGLMGGLIGGMVVGLERYGGRTIVQHIVLRFLLWNSGAMPFDVVNMLEAAHELNFLTHVSGGYRFYHRQLLEHFAAQQEPELPVVSIMGPNGQAVSRAKKL